MLYECQWRLSTKVQIKWMYVIKLEKQYILTWYRRSLYYTIFFFYWVHVLFPKSIRQKLTYGQISLIDKVETKQDWELHVN